MARPARAGSEDAGGDRAVAGGVARTAHAGRGVEEDGDGRKADGPGGRASQPRRRAGSVPSVSTTVVRRRPRRAATTCSSSEKASAEASRSCSPLPTTPRSASEETTPRRGIARRPTSTCPTRRRRRGRRAPGREGDTADGPPGRRSVRAAARGPAEGRPDRAAVGLLDDAPLVGERADDAQPASAGPPRGRRCWARAVGPPPSETSTWPPDRSPRRSSTSPRSSSASSSPTPSATRARWPTERSGCTGRSRTTSSRSRSPTVEAPPLLDPAAHHVGPGGRGLRIVRSLAHEWGVIEDPNGRTVWASLGGPSRRRSH